ncbi:MAG: PilZ domain-containing protein [Nitrospirae bacterium]|nr:MAG: PilZ domain-containing protein [Nitrospirota bacterium]
MTTGSKWPSSMFGDESARGDRFPLMRPVPYEPRAAISEAGSMGGRPRTGLTINVGSGGMCLLTDWEPAIDQVLRVEFPMPAVVAGTPTLAEVRWKRPVPFGRNGLYFVGVKFVL